MNNYDKKERYAVLMSKLKKATNNELYYEAIFIEYAIIEDRTESILRHANIKVDSNTKLHHKLNKIKSNPIFNNPYCKKHLTDELIDNLHEWKNQRNQLIHDLVKYQYGDETIKNIALQGECYVKRLSNKSKLVNNYFDKQK